LIYERISLQPKEETSYYLVTEGDSLCVLDIVVCGTK